MTAPVLLLTLAFVVLALLLLSLNLRSSWPWQVKAIAIVTTGAFFAAFFIALGGLLGWPTEAAPPQHFTLHASLVEEPRRGGAAGGAIYLWLSPLDAEGSLAGPPRAHALPYSRELHERLARAEAQRVAGRPVEGRLRAAARAFAQDSPQIELFEAPRTMPPPKTAG
ncbi:MAG TPA: hypothetical protein VFZ01_00460 [Geminicoccaceae bacterium]